MSNKYLTSTVGKYGFDTLFFRFLTHTCGHTHSVPQNHSPTQSKWEWGAGFFVRANARCWSQDLRHHLDLAVEASDQLANSLSTHVAPTPIAPTPISYTTNRKWCYYDREIEGYFRSIPDPFTTPAHSPGMHPGNTPHQCIHQHFWHSPQELHQNHEHSQHRSFSAHSYRSPRLVSAYDSQRLGLIHIDPHYAWFDQ